MCGIYTLASSPEEIQERFGLRKAPANPRPQDQVSQGELGLAIARITRDRLPVRMYFGLPPARGWAGRMILNARSETIHLKPAFRYLFKNRRCIVPATFFIEIQRARAYRRLFPFRMESRKPFGVAGIWRPLHRDPRDPVGRTICAFSVITTAAGGLVRPVHDRMPAILDPADEETWLDPPRDRRTSRPCSGLTGEREWRCARPDAGRSKTVIRPRPPVRQLSRASTLPCVNSRARQLSRASTLARVNSPVRQLSRASTLPCVNSRARQLSRASPPPREPRPSQPCGQKTPQGHPAENRRQDGRSRDRGRNRNTKRSRTEMTSMQQNGHIYVELTAPENLGPAIERVRAALGDAGIGVRDLRAVTKNEDGHITTDLLISGIWDQETGKHDCDGRCRGSGREHKGWSELTPEQQQAFARRYAQFITNCGEDELALDFLLQGAQEFGNVALSSHGQ